VAFCWILECIITFKVTQELSIVQQRALYVKVDVIAILLKVVEGRCLCLFWL
jgi:hypothetical protein